MIDFYFYYLFIYILFLGTDGLFIQGIYEFYHD